MKGMIKLKFKKGWGKFKQGQIVYMNDHIYKNYIKDNDIVDIIIESDTILTKYGFNRNKKVYSKNYVKNKLQIYDDKKSTT